MPDSTPDARAPASSLEALARALDRPVQTLHGLSGLPDETLAALADAVSQARRAAAEQMRRELDRAFPGVLRVLTGRR